LREFSLAARCGFPLSDSAKGRKLQRIIASKGSFAQIPPLITQFFDMP
jgi:hypothetical protein